MRPDQVKIIAKRFRGLTARRGRAEGQPCRQWTLAMLVSIEGATAVLVVSYF